MSQPGVSCPECPASPWTEPGRLAGHLIEVHGQGAAVALHDARRLLAPIAAALGKPVDTIASDLLHRAGVIKTNPDPKEATMAKKRKCSKCQKPGHRADKCTETTRPAPAAAPKGRRTPSGALAKIPGASNGPAIDLAGKARALVQTKIREELDMAKAYVTELERIASLA